VRRGGDETVWMGWGRFDDCHWERGGGAIARATAVVGCCHGRCDLERPPVVVVGVQIGLAS
jgi:hypothetical protein